MTKLLYRLLQIMMLLFLLSRKTQKSTISKVINKSQRLQDEKSAGRGAAVRRRLECGAARALSMARLVLGLMSCTLFITVNGLYSSSDDVIELTPSNFNREVIQSDSLWLVEFYAPWCGHCQRLTPEWKKAATALKVSFWDVHAHLCMLK